MFQGDGRFAFTPTVPTEQRELQRFADSPAIDEAIREAILIFADSTPLDLKGLVFGRADIPGDLQDHA